MDKFTNEGYRHGYIDGYLAAAEELKTKEAKPYIDKDGIIERYGGKIGINKAYQIIRAVRQVCGGGKLDSSSIILLSELEYWESLVKKETVRL